MSTWQIRPATNADAEATVAVLRASIIETGVADHQNDPAALEDWLRNKTPAQFRIWLANPDNFMVVAEADATLGGVGGIRRCGRLDLCYVHPAKQGQGVGHALLSALEAQARTWALAQIELTSTIAARGFYERFGYALAEEQPPSEKSAAPDDQYVKRLR